jgi:hypothetical protein
MNLHILFSLDGGLGDSDSSVISSLSSSLSLSSILKIGILSMYARCGSKSSIKLLRVYISNLYTIKTMRVVSIDPGTVNCGYAVWDDGKLVDIGSHNLLEMVKKSQRTDYPYIARQFMEKTQLFKNADVVLIENQMQAKMKMIACSLRCFMWNKAVCISPLSVRKHFLISNGDYRKNKKDSKAFVHRFLTKDQSKSILGTKKQDDIADAVIQLHYYLQKMKK